MQSKHQGNILFKSDKDKVIDCVVCGFAHLDPIPSEKELENYYKKDFFTVLKPDYLTKYQEEQDYWHVHYEDRLTAITSFLETANSKSRLLEIGCSAGFFLKFCQERGWDVVGIEPSESMAKYARSQGLKVINEPIEQLDAGKLGEFDAVYMRQVLEHIPNPLQTLEVVSKMLKPKGIICIEVPNDFNALQLAACQNLRKDPWWVDGPEHINYFDFDSLAGLLKKTGFDFIGKEATFPMEFFLLFGDDYIDDNTKGKMCHKKRMSFEQSLYNSGLNQTRKALYESLANNNLGREAVVYGRKP